MFCPSGISITSYCPLPSVLRCSALQPSQLATTRPLHSPRRDPRSLCRWRVSTSYHQNEAPTNAPSIRPSRLMHSPDHPSSSSAPRPPAIACCSIACSLVCDATHTHVAPVLSFCLSPPFLTRVLDFLTVCADNHDLPNSEAAHTFRSWPSGCHAVQSAHLMRFTTKHACDGPLRSSIFCSISFANSDTPVNPPYGYSYTCFASSMQTGHLPPNQPSSRLFARAL